MHPVNAASAYCSLAILSHCSIPIMLRDTSSAVIVIITDNMPIVVSNPSRNPLLFILPLSFFAIHILYEFNSTHPLSVKLYSSRRTFMTCNISFSLIYYSHRLFEVICVFFTPPKKPKLAVIYIREGNGIPAAMDAGMQESCCRTFCSDRGIQVSHSVHVNCGPEESLDVLKTLLRTLPMEVDTLIAMRFFCYSTQLPELGRLCLAFQCRPTWLYSFDIVGPIQNSFHTVTAEDLAIADQYYRSLIE